MRKPALCPRHAHAYTYASSTRQPGIRVDRVFDLVRSFYFGSLSPPPFSLFTANSYANTYL